MSAAFAVAIKIPALDAQTTPTLIVLDFIIALGACAKMPWTMLLMERRVFSFLMGIWFCFHLVNHGTEIRDRRSSALFLLVRYYVCKSEPWN